MDFNEPKPKSLSELMAPLRAALKRYWKLTFAPAFAVGAITLIVAMRLPSYYRTDSLIFVQPQRISSKVIENPDKDEVKERLESLVQEILSRPRLKSVMDRFQVYPDLKGIEGTEKAIQKFKKAIEITPAKSPTGATLLQTFELAFSHRDPKMAFEVTRALSNLFIEESLVDKRAEVQGTEEFLDSQLSEARKKLEETESQVQEFVRANFGKLPEHLEQAVARLQNLQAQLDANSQLIAANLTRRSSLDSELSETRKMVAPAAPSESPASAADSYNPHESLAQLESALVVLTSKYSDQHPDVINTRKRIEALRQQMKSGGAQAKSSYAPAGRGVSPELVISTRREMREVDVQISSLKEENERLKKNIEKLQKDIEEMPLKEQELAKIKRDYANVKANYERLLAAREDAGLQSSLIRSQKGTQFRIVEPAEMPIGPAGPPRLLIAAAGIVAAILLAFVLPIGLYFISRAYHFKEEAAEDLGIRVLGVIPPMVTPESVIKGRRQTMLSAAVSVCVVLAAGAAMVFVL